tara:strand:- start:4589 stop:5119 length:531 start_codon:yes stop_codon:yes gene_type:complete
MSFLLPKDFKPSALAPTNEELDWMYNALQPYKEQIHSVLEFGCGVTTWAVWSSVEPESYVSIETFQSCIDQVNHFIPQVEIHTDRWDDFTRLYKYDFVLVDGSTGFGPKDRSGVFRYEAILFAEQFMNPEALVMLHDHDRNRVGYKKARGYLEDNYDYLYSFSHRSGVGLYVKRGD